MFQYNFNYQNNGQVGLGLWAIHCQSLVWVIFIYSLGGREGLLKADPPTLAPFFLTHLLPCLRTIPLLHQPEVKSKYACYGSYHVYCPGREPITGPLGLVHSRLSKDIDWPINRERQVLTKVNGDREASLPQVPSREEQRGTLMFTQPSLRLDPEGSASIFIRYDAI